MTDDVVLIEALENRAQRRADRRAFFKAAVGAAAVGAAGFAFARAADAQAVTDADILNFALNLEYLEANFYYLAVYGTTIPTASMTGTGKQGAVNSAGATAVNFAAGDAYFSGADGRIIGEFAREIANDEVNHVNFLRAALGNAAVAQPAIDLSVSATSAFSKAAQAAFSQPATFVFNPYGGLINFLYGAYLFEDVGVTAYKGASPLISSKAYLDAAAGILAAEAHHAGLIRTTIDSVGDMKGLAGATIRDDTELVSTARDTLDGSTAGTAGTQPQTAADDDQGLMQTNPATGLTSNIVPTDSSGLAFSRNTGQVLNIVYLNAAQVTSGGFFPAGVNGTIVTSAKSA